MNQATASDVPVLGRYSPANPYATYEQLRAAGPVVPYLGGWAALGYDAAHEVLGDDDCFPSSNPHQPLLGRIAAGGGPDLATLQAACNGILFYMNPPAHGPIRRLIARLLARFPVASLRPAVEALVVRTLRRAQQDGGFDLVNDFARKIPGGVMASILGIRETDIALLASSSETFIEIFDNMNRPRALGRVDDAARVLADYFMKLIRERRVAPGDDGISYMIHMAKDQPAITDADLACYSAFVFTTGYHTTANFISGGASILFQNPAAVAELRDDPGKLPGATEDLLRCYSPVQFVGRIARTDRRLAGVKISRGDRLAIYIGAANHDPAVYATGTCPVLHNHGPPHLAFGDGRHLCLGAALARMEATAAFAGLLALPKLELGLDDAVWASRRNLRGLSKLPVLL